VEGVLIETSFEVGSVGPATVGGAGRALLHHRRGGLGGMVWEALEGAGWLGERTSARMAVEPLVPPVSLAAQSTSLFGFVKSVGGGGVWIATSMPRATHPLTDASVALRSFGQRRLITSAIVR
jgi:hypothetical protein